MEYFSARMWHHPQILKTVSVSDTMVSSTSRYLSASLPQVNLEESYVADVFELLLCFSVLSQAKAQWIAGSVIMREVANGDKNCKS